MADTKDKDQQKEKGSEKVGNESQEILERLLAFLSSIFQYFETLFLFGKKIIHERFQSALSGILYLQISLFFILLMIGFLSAASYLTILGMLGGDHVLTSLSMAGIALLLVFTFAHLASRKFQGK